MRRLFACLFGAFALGVPVLVTAASGASGEDWTRLKYFEAKLYELGLGTNSRWTNAEKVPPASAGFVPSLLPSWARARGETFDAIWADACKKGPQKASFTRSFLAPGDAHEALGYLVYSQGGQSAIKEVRVLLNGVLIAKAGAYRSGTNQIGPKTGDPAPLPAAPKAFKFGTNVLTIRVTKGPNAAKCGIAFVLLAKFGANLEMGESRESARNAAVPKYQKFDPAASVAVDVTATVRNDGPSAVLGGKFVVFVGGDMTINGALIQAGGKLAQCSDTALDPPRGVQKECSFGEWQPGQRERVRVVVRARVTDAVNYGERKVEITWGITDYAGVRGASPGGIYSVTVKYVACGPGSTDPNCKTPKGWK